MELILLLASVTINEINESIHPAKRIEGRTI